MQLRSIFMATLVACLLFSVSGLAQDDGNFMVRYASNLNTNDGITNMTNTGASWGENIPFSGFTSPFVTGSLISNGNICVNIYAFSGDEQLQWCCQCTLTPNAFGAFLVSEPRGNTLTGVQPTGLIIKLEATAQGPVYSSQDGHTVIATLGAAQCDATGVGLSAAPGQFAPDPTGPSVYGVPTSKGLIAWMRNNGTETAYAHSTLSLGQSGSGPYAIVGEAARNSALCGYNKINGSGFGYCNTRSFPGDFHGACPNRNGL